MKRLILLTLLISIFMLVGASSLEPLPCTVKFRSSILDGDYDKSQGEGWIVIDKNSDGTLDKLTSWIYTEIGGIQTTGTNLRELSIDRFGNKLYTLSGNNFVYILPKECSIATISSNEFRFPEIFDSQCKFVASYLISNTLENVDNSIFPNPAYEQSEVYNEPECNKKEPEGNLNFIIFFILIAILVVGYYLFLSKKSPLSKKKRRRRR